MGNNIDQSNKSGLETRMTVAERTIDNISKSVESISKSVDTGFKEIRALMSSSEKQDANRRSELHGRIDDLVKHRIISWPLVVSIIVAAFVFGGAAVSFIQMRLSPIEQSLRDFKIETSDWQKIQAENFPPQWLLDQVKRAQTQVDKNRDRISDHVEHHG